MKKNGFTLIEILAVIVVLGIVALIAIPTVTGAIEKAKIGALKNSAYGIIRSAELYYFQNNVGSDIRFDIKDGKISSQNTDVMLNYNGKIKAGTVIVNSDGKTTVCLNDGKLSAYKNYIEEEVTVVDNKNCNIPSGSLLVYADDEATVDDLSTVELTKLFQNLTGEIQALKAEVTALKENSTPTGTVVSYMGKNTPVGYLPCDGSIYNISDYKELADQIKKEFGSYNYYGGDGTATFAVPDLRGEFLRGTGTNSHTNQGSGSTVGVHQDATVLPTIWSYRDRINIAYKTNINNQPVNPDVKIGDATTFNGQGYPASVSADSSSIGYYSYSIRPTNTSVLYCIKY